MPAVVAIKDVRALLDRYLEVLNHYIREVRLHLREYEISASRLDALIARLEAIEVSKTAPPQSADSTAQDEQAQGQNIVRTADTLAALRISADEILERLAAPLKSVPRNLWWLRDWLARDATEIAAGFPSFTYAWDKLIDLNRLTLVPDSRFLRVRDNVLVATIEFERFVLALQRLVLSVQDAPHAATMSDAASSALAALEDLSSPLSAQLDPSFSSRLSRVSSLLHRKDSLEQSLNVQDADRDVDALALVGLELCFVHWLGFASPSREHRKTIIMSLIVCSKLFLIEASWQNAKDISTFAIALTTKMNADLGLDSTEGTAMLRFNQLWARHKLGEDIADEIEQWNLAGLHPRYSFLKSVLLRKFDDAVRILETLLPKKNSGETGNFSIAEAEEWPILEDFRSSDQYQTVKKRLAEQLTNQRLDRPESQPR